MSFGYKLFICSITDAYFTLYFTLHKSSISRQRFAFESPRTRKSRKIKLSLLIMIDCCLTSIGTNFPLQKDLLHNESRVVCQKNYFFDKDMKETLHNDTCDSSTTVINVGDENIVCGCNGGNFYDINFY